MTRVTVEITRHSQGWNSAVSVQYPNWTNPTLTHSGHPTLAVALWQTLSPNRYVALAEITSLTVEGVPMPLSEAYERIHAELTGSSLEYNLPQYLEFLS